VVDGEDWDERYKCYDEGVGGAAMFDEWDQEVNIWKDGECQD